MLVKTKIVAKVQVLTIVVEKMFYSDVKRTVCVFEIDYDLEPSCRLDSAVLSSTLRQSLKFMITTLLYACQVHWKWV